MKLFFYDFETTGLDPVKSAPRQLSGKITIDGKVMEEFNFYIRPFPGADIDDKALAVSNVTREELETYPDGVDVYKDLCRMLMKYVSPYEKNQHEKFVTVGYNNAKFDDQFLYNFFYRYSDTPISNEFTRGFYKGNFFNKYMTIDVYHLAMMVLAPYASQLPDFKLGTIAKFTNTLSLNEGELHNADYDLDTTFNLFKKLYKQIKPYEK